MTTSPASITAPPISDASMAVVELDFARRSASSARLSIVSSSARPAVPRRKSRVALTTRSASAFSCLVTGRRFPAAAAAGGFPPAAPGSARTTRRHRRSTAARRLRRGVSCGLQQQRRSTRIGGHLRGETERARTSRRGRSSSCAMRERGAGVGTGEGEGLAHRSGFSQSWAASSSSSALWALASISRLSSFSAPLTASDRRPACAVLPGPGAGGVDLGQAPAPSGGWLRRSRRSWRLRRSGWHAGAPGR